MNNIHAIKWLLFLKVPAPLPRIGQAVIYNRESAVENVGKLNIMDYCS